MTKKEFEEIFNAKYKECLLSINSPEKQESIRKRLEKCNYASNSETAIQMFILSAEFSKDFLHSVLEDVLEFSD